MVQKQNFTGLHNITQDNITLFKRQNTHRERIQEDESFMQHA